MRILFLTFIYTSFIFHQGLSQNSSLTQISLLTCESGVALYSTFGHSAIRVYDPVTKYDEVYNYGTFNAFEKNFYLNFLRGKLRYKLSRYSYGNFLREYHREQRGVIEQRLNLDSISQLRLLAFLENNNLPENQYYLYDFFWDNCSTRIRDIMESELNGFDYRDTLVEIKTFRQMLDENLGNLPWSDFGIDLIIGAKADKQTTFRQQMFLPEYLSEHFDKAVCSNENDLQSLVASTYTVLQFNKDSDPKNKFGISPLFLFFLILFFELILSFFIWKKGKPTWVHKYELGIYFIAGLSGLFMLLMWLGTDHQACGNNWNVLWANPLFMVFATGLLKKKELSGLRIFLILCLSFALLGWSLIPQSYHVAFIPIIIWLLIILCRNYFLNVEINSV